MTIKEMQKVAQAILDQADWIDGYKVTSAIIDRTTGKRKKCLEVSYFDRSYFMFTKLEKNPVSSTHPRGKIRKFWFEDEYGKSSMPYYDFRHAFMSLVVFVFEYKLRNIS